MATDNKSPSYLAERQKKRRWLLSNDPNAQLARKYLREMAPGGDAASVLDDDQQVAWDDIVEEHRFDAMIAANNMEARKAFELARQSSTSMGAPNHANSYMRHFASTPTWYVIRRQIETMDPEYWNDPKNVFHELLEHPEWVTVPIDDIRGQLEMYLPRKRNAL